MEKQTNTSTLTNHRRIIANKRRQKRAEIPEITWDPTARASYLTGFHHRKQLKKKAAQEKYAIRLRQERIDERKMRRDAEQEVIDRRLEIIKRIRGQVDTLEDDQEMVSSQEDEKEENVEEKKKIKEFKTMTTITTVTTSLDEDLIHEKVLAKASEPISSSSSTKGETVVETSDTEATRKNTKKEPLRRPRGTRGKKNNRKPSTSTGGPSKKGKGGKSARQHKNSSTRKK